MPYFAPCIDETGIHMPTYEDRLADLSEAYRNIFGIDTELSESVPDYQLLSVFAKALDDVSALVLQAYNSRNPMYATGNALDLLLPQYGLTRQPGETDASCRARIRHSLSGRSMGTADALLSAVKSVPVVKDAKLYINESDTTDANGIPAHSVAVVTRGGETDALPSGSAALRKAKSSSTCLSRCCRVETRIQSVIPWFRRSRTISTAWVSPFH